MNCEAWCWCYEIWVLRFSVVRLKLKAMMCICIMRLDRKSERTDLILASPFSGHSFFLPHPTFPTGAQHCAQRRGVSCAQPVPAYTSCAPFLRFGSALSFLKQYQVRQSGKQRDYLASCSWKLKSQVLLWSLGEVYIVTESRWQNWGERSRWEALAFL